MSKAKKARKAGKDEKARKRDEAAASRPAAVATASPGKKAKKAKLSKKAAVAATAGPEDGSGQAAGTGTRRVSAPAGTGAARASRTARIGFDRVRPPRSAGELADGTDERDPRGVVALFSAGGTSDRPLGALTLECSACREETPVTALELARLAFPFALALPMLKGDSWAYLRCPACGHRTWMQPHLRL